MSTKAASAAFRLLFRKWEESFRPGLKAPVHDARLSYGLMLVPFTG